MRRPKTLSQLIDDQRRWIDEHGATLSGYIARYGAKAESEDSTCYGNGGRAIYAADVAELRRLQAIRAR